MNIEYEEFYLSHIHNAKIQGDEVNGRCCFHEDRRASFSGNIKTGLWMCHAGCGHGNAWQFAERLGIEPPGKNGRGTKQEVITNYEYKDEHGQPLFRICRTMPKGFFGQRYEDGHWVNGLKEIRRVLYRLPEVLKAQVVYIVEGEKDVDRLWSMGIPATCNPGGAGKWRDEYSESLAEKKAVVIPDNDEPGEDHALQVARSLHPFAEAVKVVYLPGLEPRKEKHGEDISDWFDGGHTKEELAQQVKDAPKLTPQDLAPVAESTQTNKKKQSIPPELEERVIHPALHLERGFSSVGVINRNKAKVSFSVVTSEGREYAAKDIEEVLTTRPIIHPELSGRWKRSEEGRTLSVAIVLLIEKARSLIWFEDERWYSFISLWCAGTYLFPAFPAFPYIQLTGEKGSGKTKTEDLLECVCFNALRMIDPTPAVLFRIVEALRPTLLLDEIEKMNTDEAKEVRGIINAGYKQRATVSRVEGEDRHIKFFHVYSPKCLAGIKGLGSVTEDRCITVVMSKPSQEDSRQNRVVDPTDTEWAVIRDSFYRLPFSYGDKILQGLDEKSFPVWLRARDRELWSPLLHLALLVDGESDLGISRDVLGLAHDSVSEGGLTFEAEAVLGLLEGRLDGTGVLELHPVDLAEELEASLNRQKISPEWIAGRLRSLGFKRTGRDRRGVIYQVRAEKLSNIRCRYTPPEQPTHLHTPELTQPELPENRKEL